MAGRGGYRRIVLGLDGSAHSRRAAAFIARLKPPAGGRVNCVRVVEPVRRPSMPLVPASMRSLIAGQAAALNRSRVAAAQRELDATGARLGRAGWRVRGEVRSGAPLPGLLAAVQRDRADLLVLGARGRSRPVARFLLGSVTEGALKRAPVSVLIVR